MAKEKEGPLGFKRPLGIGPLTKSRGPTLKTIIEDLTVRGIKYYSVAIDPNGYIDDWTESWRESIAIDKARLLAEGCSERFGEACSSMVIEMKVIKWESVKKGKIDNLIP